MNNSSRHNNYHCPSLWPLHMPLPQLVLFASITAILSPVVLLSNLGLIYGLYKTRQLNTITNKFVLLMNTSDLCIGLFILPSISAMTVYNYKYRHCVIELTVQYIAFLFPYFSFFMLMCVSMDRYLHVTKLNKYNAFMNEFRMKVIVVIGFVTSAMIAYIPIAIPSFLLQIAVNIFNLLCMIFVFLVYSKVIRSITVHVERFKDMLRSAGSDASNKDTGREITATKTIRLVLGAMLVLYLPYNICSAFWTYYKYHQGRNPPLALNVIEYWAYTILFSNAAINAILFAHGNKMLRRNLISKIVKNQVSSVK